MQIQETGGGSALTLKGEDCFVVRVRSERYDKATDILGGKQIDGSTTSRSRQSCKSSHSSMPGRTACLNLVAL